MLTNKNFLFYDLETTGTNPCFDQAIQFAAIRTDLAFNELEQFNIRIRLNPDVIPHLEAMLVHGIDINTMRSSGISELEAMQQIHRLINTPNTISLGYNTLGFDDEFLRFSFYRNLLSPYTHQFANGCYRMDIYPITVLFYLFKQQVLSHWPENDGKVSLKLERLNQVNQWVQGSAHDALVDVKATVALAKTLATQREMWNYAMGYFQKTVDQQRLSRLIQVRQFQTHYPVALMVNGKFGAKNYFQAPVLNLGQHKHYRNQSIWLRLDNSELLSLTPETIENSITLRKRAGEPPIILPWQERFTHYLSSERLDMMDHVLAKFTTDATLLQQISNYHLNYTYPVVADCDVDAALYQLDFTSNNENELFQRFHQAKPEDKLAIAKQFPTHERYEQAIRLLARHYPECLSSTDYQVFADYLNQINDQAGKAPIDFRGQARLTRAQVQQQLETYIQAHPEQQKKALIDSYEDYLSTVCQDDNS